MYGQPSAWTWPGGRALDALQSVCPHSSRFRQPRTSAPGHQDVPVRLACGELFTDLCGQEGRLWGCFTNVTPLGQEGRWEEAGEGKLHVSVGTKRKV